MAENAATEEIKNCAACNKPMNKAKRYYRNGTYFCNKNCFKLKLKKDKAAQEEKKEQ